MTGETLRTAAAHIDVAPDILASEANLVLADDDERYLTKVLRLRTGETVTVTDRQGSWRPTTALVERGAVMLEPAGDVHREAAPPEFAIAAAIPKGDRLDWMVQKLTELGASRIVLLHCERSVVRWPDKKLDSGRSRLSRIVTAACRQSRRVWWPDLVGPLLAVEVLPSALVAEPGGQDLTASLAANSQHFETRDADVDAASMLTVAIGPEGGWSDEERALGVGAITLGVNVLRTETAAICAASLLGVFAPIPSVRSKSLE